MVKNHLPFIISVFLHRIGLLSNKGGLIVYKPQAFFTVMCGLLCLCRNLRVLLKLMFQQKSWFPPWDWSDERLRGERVSVRDAVLICVCFKRIDAQTSAGRINSSSWLDGLWWPLMFDLWGFISDPLRLDTNCLYIWSYQAKRSKF